MKFMTTFQFCLKPGNTNGHVTHPFLCVEVILWGITKLPWLLYLSLIAVIAVVTWEALDNFDITGAF